MRTIVRVAFFTAAVSIILMSAGSGVLKAEPAMQAASTPNPDCDRECLRGFWTKYIDALTAHKPGDLPVSDKLRVTEDNVEIKLGEGIWKTVSKVLSSRTDALDLQTGITGGFISLEEDGKPVMLFVRLKVVNKKIVEIKTQVTRNAIFDKWQKKKPPLI